MRVQKLDAAISMSSSPLSGRLFELRIPDLDVCFDDTSNGWAKDVVGCAIECLECAVSYESSADRETVKKDKTSSIRGVLSNKNFLTPEACSTPSRPK